MDSTVTAPADTRDEHARAIFDLGVQAGLQLAAQRAKLTQLAATVCVLPGCIANHDRGDENCVTDLVHAGPIATAVEYNPARGHSLELVGNGDPEYLNLDEHNRLIANLIAQRDLIVAARAGAR